MLCELVFDGFEPRGQLTVAAQGASPSERSWHMCLLSSVLLDASLVRLNGESYDRMGFSASPAHDEK